MTRSLPMASVIAPRIWSTLIVFGFLGLGACTTRPKVSTKSVSTVRLERYKTYTFLPGKIYDSESGTTGDPMGVGRDLETDVRDELDRRGLIRADKDPDLTFSFV